MASKWWPSCALCHTLLKFEVRNGVTYERCPGCGDEREVPRVQSPEPVYVTRIRRGAA